MRDWSKSFANDRLQRLESLDITGKPPFPFSQRTLALILWIKTLTFSHPTNNNTNEGVGMSDEDTQRFVACLENTPMLQRLRISGNYFSLGALELLGKQIAKGSLRNLLELECSGAFCRVLLFCPLVSDGERDLMTNVMHMCFALSAIAADVNAMGTFFESFQETACPKLQAVNVSGNPVANVKTCFKFAHVFAKQCWPRLTYLDMSSTYLDTSLK